MNSRHHVFALIVVFALLLFSSSLHAQTTWYVDDDAPGDPGPGDTSISDPLEDGSAAHPFDAIQQGIDAAVYGDTVLVADGLYTGTGNRDMSFLGKAITVRSANGPENCTVDGEGNMAENRWGFEFINGEGPDSILDGLTITHASGHIDSTTTHGCAVYISGASPTITGNVISQCAGDGDEGGLYCFASAARIVGNTIVDNSAYYGGGLNIRGWGVVIEGNTIANNRASYGGGVRLGYLATSVKLENNVVSGNEAYVHGGGVYIVEVYSPGHLHPKFENNRITGNIAGQDGGGLWFRDCMPEPLVNNLVAGNHAGGNGGGLCCEGIRTGLDEALIVNGTLADNTAGSDGGGLWAEQSTILLENCILAGNGADRGENLFLGGEAQTVTAAFDHCLIRDAAQTVQVGSQTLIQVSPILFGDPLFVAGPWGGHCIGQTAAGQGVDSPALDAGNDLAANICTIGGDETICLDALSTRTDGVADSGAVDLGYHYPVLSGTVLAALACAPQSGILPFATRMTVDLVNTTNSSRRVAASITVLTAGGGSYSNWRTGYTNLSPLESYTISWNQNLPGSGALVGDNLFSMSAEDVTPAPWNQPPYSPAGDTDAASCTVTGTVP